MLHFDSAWLLCCTKLCSSKHRPECEPLNVTSVRKHFALDQFLVAALPRTRVAVSMRTGQDVLAAVEHLHLCAKVSIYARLLCCDVASPHYCQPAHHGNRRWTRPSAVAQRSKQGACNRTNPTPIASLDITATGSGQSDQQWREEANRELVAGVLHSQLPA